MDIATRAGCEVDEFRATSTPTPLRLRPNKSYSILKEQYYVSSFLIFLLIVSKQVMGQHSTRSRQLRMHPAVITADYLECALYDSRFIVTVTQR